MTEEVDPKIVKIEPEEENKVNLFLNTQRHLVVNNDIKDEFFDDLCNMNLNNQIENASDEEKGNGIKCVDDVKTGIREVDYDSINALMNNMIEDSIGNQGNNSNCTNLEITSKQNLIKNSTKLTTNSTFNNSRKYSTIMKSSLVKRKRFETYKCAKHQKIKYKCEQCDYSTYRKGNLKSHSVKHEGIKYKCEQCDYSTYRKGNLKKHSVKHKGIKYKCEQCDYSTYRKDDLKKHSVKHKGIKYKCEQCDYSTYRKDNLARHCSKHQGIKYKCEQCDFSTIWRSVLKRHSAKHRGNRYSCYRCDFSTYRKDNLAQHCAKHQGNSTKWKNRLKNHSVKHKGVNTNVNNATIQHIIKTKTTFSQA